MFFKPYGNWYSNPGLHCLGQFPPRRRSSLPLPSFLSDIRPDTLWDAACTKNQNRLCQDKSWEQDRGWECEKQKRIPKQDSSLCSGQSRTMPRVCGAFDYKSNSSHPELACQHHSGSLASPDPAKCKLYSPVWEIFLTGCPPGTESPGNPLETRPRVLQDI